jgi:hypothetical protein
MCIQCYHALVNNLRYITRTGGGMRTLWTGGNTDVKPIERHLIVLYVCMCFVSLIFIFMIDIVLGLCAL